MVALQIRDVPDEVRDVLAERARAEGRSLQAFLLALVEGEARRSRNLLVMRSVSGRSDGSRLSADEADARVAAERANRPGDGASGAGHAGT